MFVRFAFVLMLVIVLAWSVLTRVSEATGTPEPYRVQAGDTLWTIADEHYGGDPRRGVWAIRRENGLGGSGVSPGQVLLLP
ncbi:MAG TPA: LysM peptidoglycan-binding domain-containing protein [Gaiellaceae bacterium]|jgi:nucleoid-associated protein YgaU|nr:LysM peptidoglycan-binding domain-containing protein [Gaiellaceae bacterium]HEX2496331.1 LysM peptidoglycan-binding domain-containing protein [Gaiellaceae bacterium]